MKPFLSTALSVLAVASALFAAPARAEDYPDISTVLAHLVQTPGALPALEAKLADGKSSIGAIYSASNVEKSDDGVELDEFHHVIEFSGDAPFSLDLWRSYEFGGEVGASKVVRSEFRFLTPVESKVAHRWMRFFGYPATNALEVLFRNPDAIAALRKATPSGTLGDRISINSDYDRSNEDDVKEVFSYEVTVDFSASEWGFVTLAITVGGTFDHPTYTYRLSEKSLPHQGPAIDPMPVR